MESRHRPVPEWEAVVPERLSWAARLARAEAYLYEARQVFLPPEGQLRGAAMRHKQAVLRHGRWEIARLAGKRPPRSASTGEIARAVWLMGQLDEEEPELLDVLRARERQGG
jgi:hypothetical protein